MSSNQNYLKDPSKTIVIAPLDWGLGHATRIIPIIHFLKKHFRIIVAIPENLAFLYNDLHIDIEFVSGYNIKYYRRFPVTVSLALQTIKIIVAAHQDKRQAKIIAAKYNPEYIISDNRPFFRSKSSKNVYITHQLTVPYFNRFISKTLTFFHRKAINRFDTCLIPDTEQNELAGILSQGDLKISRKSIGGLSRFMLQDNLEPKSWDYVFVISGPEPERSGFIEETIERFQDYESTIIIGAIKGVNFFQKKGNLTVTSQLDDRMFASILKGAKRIVVKGGYSSLMDLLWLQKKAVFIPTKGQFEQEYLCKIHDGKLIEYAKSIDDVINKFEESTHEAKLKESQLFFISSDLLLGHLQSISK